ncbi:hypothetical protein F2P81_021090 [Scophthalmus maximus]|uniref:Uncharacterized protein n=1 Tax=Scophthalmus maximus TaxID=52904 RepID=A0A6A4RWB8_SCOMX|nr:hypothetical protein F2P81_021090 [Scophthalmus maximus]
METRINMLTRSHNSSLGGVLIGNRQQSMTRLLAIVLLQKVTDGTKEEMQQEEMQPSFRMKRQTRRAKQDGKRKASGQKTRNRAQEQDLEFDSGYEEGPCTGIKGHYCLSAVFTILAGCIFPPYSPLCPMIPRINYGCILGASPPPFTELASVRVGKQERIIFHVTCKTEDKESHSVKMKLDVYRINLPNVAETMGVVPVMNVTQVIVIQVTEVGISSAVLENNLESKLRGSPRIDFRDTSHIYVSPSGMSSGDTAYLFHNADELNYEFEICVCVTKLVTAKGRCMLWLPVMSRSAQTHVLRAAPGKSSPEETPSTERCQSEHLGKPGLRRCD